MNDVVIALLALGAVMAVLMGVRDWRRSVFWLLLYIPFAGLPTIALYPAPAITRVLKDICFVVPAYLGFAAWAMQRGGLSGAQPAALPLRGAAALFALMVCAQAFNPHSVNAGVVGVGLKTWLFYMPLLMLGFNLVSTRAEVERVFCWMLMAAVVPVVLGITQSLLISAGRSDLAYRPYGDAAYAISQGFSETVFAFGRSRRAPGVFTFVTQYYNFLLATVAIAFSVALARRRAGRAAALYFGFTAVVALAAFLSGSRGVFLTVPLLLVIASVLSGNAMVAAQTAGLTTVALTVAAVTFGTTLSELWEHTATLFVNYVFASPLSEFRVALTLGYWGMGTGYNTGPARLAAITTASGPVVENYLAKAFVELGVAGLGLLLLLVAALMTQAASSMRRIRDPQTRLYGIGICAFLIVSVFNFWKGSYLDIDPLNVYFWLLAGILFRLPTVVSERLTSPRQGIGPRAVRSLSAGPRRIA